MRILLLPAVAGWLCVLLLTGAGCATRSTIRVETLPAGHVYVAWSDVRSAADGLIVSGVVRRSDRIGPPVPVTVSVEVLSPSGAILDTVQSDRIDVPCRKADRVQGFQRFKVRLPGAPANGSSLRIVPRSS